MKAAVGFGSRWMTDLINNIVKEGCIPDVWWKSILVPAYKGKGDPLVCGSYRATKLLEQPMKVLERVLESSDYLSILIRLQMKTTPKPGLRQTYVNLRKANWDRYSLEVEAALSKRLLPTDCQRDEKILRTILLKAASYHIPTGRHRLGSYKSRINKDVGLDVCADCGKTPHDVKHFFNCPAHPRP